MQSDSICTPDTSSQITNVFCHTYLTRCAHRSDLPQTVNQSEVCVYACTVLHSHTELTKHNGPIITKMHNSKFLKKETRFVTAYK